MGFFSWKTSDTRRSIANIYSVRKVFTVHMITEDGRVFTEKNYEGYGDFGGKDFYELVAELNGLTTRDDGITIQFKDNPTGKYNGTYKLPKLVEVLNTAPNNKEEWKRYFDGLEHSEICPEQGFFYGDDEDMEEECSCGQTLDGGWCINCDELK